VGKDKKSSWGWALGLLATGIAGAAVVVLRGCWHRKMSWPVRHKQYSYQVCLGCGTKRLFDEQTFRAYGPYSYDLNRLVTWHEETFGGKESEAEAQNPAPRHEHRPAS